MLSSKTKGTWVGIDLDATLADDYEGETYHPLKIGKPVEGMVKLVKAWLDSGFEVRVFTARVHPNGSAPGWEGFPIASIRQAIRDWTEQHIGVPLEATCEKDCYMEVLYDDRARQVQANTGKVAQSV